MTSIEFISFRDPLRIKAFEDLNNFIFSVYSQTYNAAKDAEVKELLHKDFKKSVEVLSARFKLGTPLIPTMTETEFLSLPQEKDPDIANADITVVRNPVTPNFTLVPELDPGAVVSDKILFDGQHRVTLWRFREGRQELINEFGESIDLKSSLFEGDSDKLSNNAAKILLLLVDGKSNQRRMASYAKMIVDDEIRFFPKEPSAMPKNDYKPKYEKSSASPVDDGWQIVSMEMMLFPGGPWAFNLISPTSVFYFGFGVDSGPSKSGPYSGYFEFIGGGSKVHFKREGKELDQKLLELSKVKIKEYILAHPKIFSSRPLSKVEFGTFEGMVVEIF